jgi:hypothetical protein
VRVAVAQKDQVGLMTWLKKLLAITDPAAEEPLILAARMEKDRFEVGIGLELAAQYASRFPAGAWVDEAAFIMAQLLEADSQFRDIAKARDLYGGIVKSFPESAFAGPARERLLYLERHFFLVR